jgi:hypothetical protein
MPRVSGKDLKAGDVRNIRKEVARLKYSPPEFFKILRQAAVREKLDRPITYGTKSPEAGGMLSQLFGGPRGIVKRQLSKTQKAKGPAVREMIGVKPTTKGLGTAKALAKSVPALAASAAVHGVPVAGPILGEMLAHSGTNVLRKGLAHSALGQYLAQPGIERSRAGLATPVSRTGSWVVGSPLLEQMEKAHELAGKYERAAGQPQQLDTRTLGQRIRSDVGSWIKRKAGAGVAGIKKRIPKIRIPKVRSVRAK